jgi:hypothetical protein
MYNKNINKKKSHFHLRTMSSTHSDSNSKKVYQQPGKPTIQDVIAAWKKVASTVQHFTTTIKAHPSHQLRIELYHVEKALQGVQLSVWERIVFFLGQNQAEYEDRMAKENLLKLLVEACAKKVQDGGHPDVRKWLREIANSAIEAHSVMESWIQSILDRFMSEITKSAITVTDMVRLLRSLKEVFGETNEAKLLLQKVQGCWTQSAQNRILSVHKDTTANSLANTGTIMSIALPLLQVWEGVYKKSNYAKRVLEEISKGWLGIKPITHPDDKPCYVCDCCLGWYSLPDDIQSIITEVITADEEVTKLFPSSSDESDT